MPSQPRRPRRKRRFGNIYCSRGSWYVRYSVRGVRHHVRAGDREEDAEALLARLTLDHARDRLEGRAHLAGTTLGEFAPRLWAVWERTLRPATVATRRKAVRDYAARLTRPMRDLTAPEAEAALLDRLAEGLRVSTVHHDRRVLSSVWGMAARMGVVREGPNPWKAARLPPVEREPHRRLTESELVALYAAAPPDLALPVLLMGEAGLRRGEAISLLWASVAADRGAVTVRAAVAKSRRFRVVPASPRLAEALDAAGRLQLPTAHVCGVSSSRLNHGFRELADGLGLRDVTPHSLRHTAAHRWAEAGVPLHVVRDLLGHSSITQTEVYAATTEEATLRAAVAHAESLRASISARTSAPRT